MGQLKYNNIFKLSIHTFMITLIISSFVYESSGMTSALLTLQEGKFSVILTQLLSVSYIAAIATALVIVVYYFGGQLLSPEFFKNTEKANRNGQYPELVVVNPNATKELIDKMNLSVN
ncbi:MAG: hypothetical protein AAFQ94_17620 [Bacteroidota bacterium]